MKSLAKNYIFKALLCVLVVLLDQISKLLCYQKSFVIIPFLLGSRDVPFLNTGGAWGIFGDNLWLLILLTILFLAFVIVTQIKWKNTSKLYSVALVFIVGGAIGNLLDRIALGGVRDFLYFPFFDSFPTFNVADSFLCVGMILLFVYVIFFYKKEGKNAVQHK